MSSKVSVIIPIYNVGNFIGHCAESLLTQTLDDVQFIFVDDCTKDDSIGVLEKVVGRFPGRNVTILHHKENAGLPTARNTGLNVADGEYIFHCDGDDWVEPDLLEKMYAAAESHSADIVYCDFYLTYENNERRMNVPDFDTADAMLRKGMLSGTMKYNVWNKLVRRALYTDNGISFPDGHPMGEDMTMILLASHAGRVFHVGDALYHYVQTNSSAYSKTFSEKQLQDVFFNVSRVEQHLDGAYEKELGLFKLSIKLPFLISEDPEQYRKWREIYPEADKFICKGKEVPFRTRFIEYCATMKLDFLIRWYNIIVYKFVMKKILLHR